jgi:hypothetical protein
MRAAAGQRAERHGRRGTTVPGSSSSGPSSSTPPASARTAADRPAHPTSARQITAPARRLRRRCADQHRAGPEGDSTARRRTGQSSPSRLQPRCSPPAPAGKPSAPPHHSTPPGQRVEWPRATTDSGHLSFHVDALSKMVSRTSMASMADSIAVPGLGPQHRQAAAVPSYSAAYLASSATGAVTLL